MITILTFLITVAATANACTIEEAAEIALASRGDVQAAREDLHGAVWESRGADMWFLPSISGQLAYIYSHDVQVMDIPGMGTVPMGTEWSSQYGLSATLPLYVAQGPAGSRMASRAEQLSSFQLKATEQDVVAQVVEAFYGVLLAEMMVDVTEEALRTAGEGYKLAQARFDAGTISRFELLQSRVAYENRRPDSISAVRSLENATAGFSVALGQGSDRIVFIEGLLSDPLPVAIPSTLENAREIMTENSPDLKMTDLMRGVSEARVDLARAGFLPKLVVKSDYFFQAGVEDLGDVCADDYHRTWSTSIALEIPLFTGYSDISGYNSARAYSLAADAQARSIEQATDLSLIQAWNSLQATREQLYAIESTLTQAEEASGIAAISYEAGTITRLDMDQAFLALTQARSNQASQLYQMRVAEARLARTMGILQFEKGR